MQGALVSFREDKDMTSEISSRVPVPPGKAMKASDRRMISVLRCGKSGFTISSVSPVCW